MHRFTSCAMYPAHRTPEIRQHAESLNITLHFIPAGLTDQWQPLDCKVFGYEGNSEARVPNVPSSGTICGKSHKEGNHTGTNLWLGSSPDNDCRGSMGYVHGARRKPRAMTRTWNASDGATEEASDEVSEECE